MDTEENAVRTQDPQRMEASGGSGLVGEICSSNPDPS